jgi:hypothetical protein
LVPVLTPSTFPHSTRHHHQDDDDDYGGEGEGAGGAGDDEEDDEDEYEVRLSVGWFMGGGGVGYAPSAGTGLSRPYTTQTQH